ncbi:MAG: hypothetical protein DRR19_27375 [Candidatus Parabeggiatoa sp. nov. 1]|nr:MAG: hypothetical protein DRR19_27375 [Gammaproteobacteria bacterium]
MPTSSNFRVLKDLEGRKTIQVKSSDKPVELYELYIKDELLEVTCSGGQLGQGSLTTFYEPQTGLFGWEYVKLYLPIDVSHPKTVSGRLNLSLEDFHFYLSPSEGVLFVFSGFRFKKFSQRYDTFEQAHDQLMAHLETQRDAIAAGESDHWYQNISVRKQLPAGFYHRYFDNYEGRRTIHNPYLMGVARITNVTYQDGEWKVEVKNRVNERYSIFIFNEKMECVRYLGITVIGKALAKAGIQHIPIDKKELPLVSYQFEVFTLNSEGQVKSRKERTAEQYTEDLGHGVVLEMVLLNGGHFMMGSPGPEKNEWGYRINTPQHSVTIAPFYLGKYLVTQDQWFAVMGDNPSQLLGKNRPVEWISWLDAVEFCQRLSQMTGKPYRLPSEAEWEYACRAGTSTDFYFGETITTKLVNYCPNPPIDKNRPCSQEEDRQQTTDVGIFPPNGFGLYDMHGNVSEWCADPWHNNYLGAPSYGRVWAGTELCDKVLRGGSFKKMFKYCWTSIRWWKPANYEDDDQGFRVAIGPVITTS